MAILGLGSRIVASRVSSQRAVVASARTTAQRSPGLGPCSHPNSAGAGQRTAEAALNSSRVPLQTTLRRTPLSLSFLPPFRLCLAGNPFGPVHLFAQTSISLPPSFAETSRSLSHLSLLHLRGHVKITIFPRKTLLRTLLAGARYPGAAAQPSPTERQTSPQQQRGPSVGSLLPYSVQGRHPARKHQRRREAQRGERRDPRPISPFRRKSPTAWSQANLPCAVAPR